MNKKRIWKIISLPSIILLSSAAILPVLTSCSDNISFTNLPSLNTQSLYNALNDFTKDISLNNWNNNLKNNNELKNILTNNVPNFQEITSISYDNNKNGTIIFTVTNSNLSLDNISSNVSLNNNQITVKNLSLKNMVDPNELYNCLNRYSSLISKTDWTNQNRIITDQINIILKNNNLGSIKQIISVSVDNNNKGKVVFTTHTNNVVLKYTSSNVFITNNNEITIQNLNFKQNSANSTTSNIKTFNDALNYATNYINQIINPTWFEKKLYKSFDDRGPGPYNFSFKLMGNSTPNLNSPFHYNLTINDSKCYCFNIYAYPYLCWDETRNVLITKLAISQRDYGWPLDNTYEQFKNNHPDYATNSFCYSTLGGADAFLYYNHNDIIKNKIFKLRFTNSGDSENGPVSFIIDEIPPFENISPNEIQKYLYNQ